MGEFKGTPGPWINVGGWVDAENNGIICSLSSVDRKPEEVSDANANLIAAAPELLEALQDLVVRCRVYVNTTGAQAAIAKALGESQ